MIIGVDAGALSVTDERLKVGVWRVVHNLLGELGKIDRENLYRLYTFLPLSEKFGPRMTNVVLQQRGWFSLWLPLELWRHPVDIFLGLSQAMPETHAKNIGFVYDLGFLHHPEAYLGSLRKLKRQTEDLVKRSHHILAISLSTKEDLQRSYGVSPKNITVAYPGVDERFKPNGARFLNNNPYFLFVGALKRGKNIPFALRAFAAVLGQTKQPIDFFIIGGDFWRDPEIDETIKKYHLEKNVKLLGYVPDNDLPKYYRGAVSLIIPSLWEGFCLPAVEAMKNGCPVISSNAGALPEIIGNAGITISSEKELADAMKLIISDKTKREEFVKKGLTRAKKFSWHVFGKSVYKVINSL